MKYLKIVNCPLKGCLNKDNKGNIDWTGMGFNVTDVQRLSLQGHTEYTDGKLTGDFLTLLPITDEAKFAEVEQDIINNINNNVYENDTAEVVEQAVYDAEKAIIEDIKAKAKLATQA